MAKLGVNIDHVATLRNARGVDFPNPLAAALVAEAHGADGGDATRDDHRVVMNRYSRVILLDEKDRPREQYDLNYGAKLMVKDGDRVKGGQVMSEWDPFAMPFVTEVSGYVKYGDVVDGVLLRQPL